MKTCYQGHVVAHFCAISNISVQSVELFIFLIQLPALNYCKNWDLLLNKEGRTRRQNTHLMCFIAIIDFVSIVQAHFSFRLSSCSQLVISLNQIWTEGSIEGNSVDVFGYETHWSDIFACSGRNQ